MNESVAEIIGGIILVIVIFGGILLFSDGVIPDLRSDGGYEPCESVGHPLYEDC